MSPGAGTAARVRHVHDVTRDLHVLVADQDAVCAAFGVEVEVGRARFRTLRDAFRGAVERTVEVRRGLVSAKKRVGELKREVWEARKVLEESQAERRVIGKGLREAVREKEAVVARLRKAVEKGVETARKLKRERCLRKKLVARVLLVQTDSAASTSLAGETLSSPTSRNGQSTSRSPASQTSAAATLKCPPLAVAAPSAASVFHPFVPSQMRPPLCRRWPFPAPRTPSSALLPTA